MMLRGAATVLLALAGACWAQSSVPPIADGVRPPIADGILVRFCLPPCCVCLPPALLHASRPVARASRLPCCMPPARHEKCERWLPHVTRRASKWFVCSLDLCSVSRESTTAT